MGVKELREAFNAAAPGFSCAVATLGYERAHDTEWQILIFRGSDVAGAPFEVRSDPIPPNGDIMLAAAATAQRLVDTQFAMTPVAESSPNVIQDPAGPRSMTP